ncbi:MAG: hypothetical protein QXL78_04880 [Methanocellales archaeon]
MELKEERGKFIRELKSLAGIFGIAVIDKTNSPIVLEGVTEGESAQIAHINAALSEISKAFSFGKSLQTLIIAKNYKILIYEREEKYIIFMDPGASLHIVKSKFKDLH